MSVISGADYTSRLPIQGAHKNSQQSTQIREMQEMTKIIKKEMDPKAYEEMRMALMGWAHTKNYMKAVFDAWKAAVESLNDEEEGTGDGDAGKQKFAQHYAEGLWIYLHWHHGYHGFCRPTCEHNRAIRQKTSMFHRFLLV